MVYCGSLVIRVEGLFFYWGLSVLSCFAGRDGGSK